MYAASRSSSRRTPTSISKTVSKMLSQNCLSRTSLRSLCDSLLMVWLVLYICQLENFFILCFSTHENILTHTHTPTYTYISIGTCTCYYDRQRQRQRRRQRSLHSFLRCDTHTNTYRQA